MFSGGSGRLIYEGVDRGGACRAPVRKLRHREGAHRAGGASRATRLENARFTRELVQPKPGERWLLVTSAHHMPRSVGVFRAAGFPVEAFPVDCRTRGAIDMLRPFSTLGDGLRRTDTAAREWVGLGGLSDDRADGGTVSGAVSSRRLSSTG